MDSDVGGRPRTSKGGDAAPRGDGMVQLRLPRRLPFRTRFLCSYRSQQGKNPYRCFRSGAPSLKAAGPRPRGALHVSDPSPCPSGLSRSSALTELTGGFNSAVLSSLPPPSHWFSSPSPSIGRLISLFSSVLSHSRSLKRLLGKQVSCVMWGP